MSQTHRLFMTQDLAYAAAKDASFANMQKAGRKVPNDEDMEVYCDAFNRLFSVENMLFARFFHESHGYKMRSWEDAKLVARTRKNYEEIAQQTS